MKLFQVVKTIEKTSYMKEPIVRDVKLYQVHSTTKGIVPDIRKFVVMQVKGEKATHSGEGATFDERYAV